MSARVFTLLANLKRSPRRAVHSCVLFPAFFKRHCAGGVLVLAIAHRKDKSLRVAVTGAQRQKKTFGKEERNLPRAEVR